MRERLLWFVILLLVCASSSARAQTPSGNTSPQEPKPPEAAKPAETVKPWWERLTFYGDLRLRYEGFYQDETETRHRERFRFRVGMRTPIAEGLDLNLRLGSGDPADVTSTNQSFTDFLNRKSINIDQLSLAYTPSQLKALTLGAGKYAFPVTRTQMVWDDDVNWEGTYEVVRGSVGGVGVRVVGVQSPINEVGAGEDAFMFGEYVEAGFAVGRHTAQVSVADYAFRHADQIAVALDQRAVIRTQSTNALRRNPAGRVVGFQSGFNLVDVIGQMTFATGRPQYPLTALADVVINTEASSADDTGVWLVGGYGRAAAARTFAVTYTFARVERDAVVSAYNFSDMGPATNVVMNMATFSYAPRSRVNLDFIGILTRLLDPPAGDQNALLKRVQIDARVSF